jgi:FAD/FMN-containing dehydrogenase
MSASSKRDFTEAIEVAGRGNKRVHLTPAHLRELHTTYNERLIRPGDDGWDNAIQIWNGMVAKTPALVLQPSSAQEVAGAVQLARKSGMLLSIKGGGHNIAGTSIAENGLTLDMSRMKTVTVDVEKRIVHVGAGCLLQDVDRETQKYGLATVLGFISETGVAGLTLGGGFGYLARRFGWAVDNLEEVEIVTADGEVRTANRDHNYELFWAIRGGGGNFGVVTRFTFRLHRVGPTVYGGLIAWPFERAEEIFSTYRSLTATSPRELAVWLVLVNAPPAPFVPVEWQGKRVCAMSVCYSGDLRNTAEVMAPIHSLEKPVFDLLREQPYVELQSQLDATEPKGAHYY